MVLVCYEGSGTNEALGIVREPVHSSAAISHQGFLSLFLCGVRMKSSNRPRSIVKSRKQASGGDAAVSNPLRLKIMLKPKGFPDTRPSLLAQLAEYSDQPRWREFFERYAPPVFRVIRRRGLSNEDANDIVQQVMLNVSRHIGNFRYDRDRGRFRQWIRRITENLITSHFRAKRPIIYDHELCEELVDEAPATEDIWDAEWELQDILWCLDQLEQDVPPRRMRAFRMYVVEGRSAADVGKELGMTAGHVHVIRHQTLALLRKRMAALYHVDSVTLNI